jgi:hypothetical protein
MDRLTAQSTSEEVAAFWQRAETERPLLSAGMLRPADQKLATAYGFTQLDVAWEAHFHGADDREAGWVLRFRDGTDMAHRLGVGGQAGARAPSCRSPPVPSETPRGRAAA